MRVVHQREEDRQLIRVSGLEEPLRLYHFSDTHLQLHDQRDAESVAHWLADPDLLVQDSPACLKTHLQRAADWGADVIALTGDLLHFPSQLNIEVALESFDRCSVPLLYTPGNHDWFFPGQEGWESLRDRMIHLLDPLTGGMPDCSARDFGNLRFISVDNSTYYVTRPQLEFIRDQLNSAAIAVVQFHIPLSLPSLRDDVLAKFPHPIMMADPAVDHRKRVEGGSDVPATLELVDLLVESPALVAILSAHVHMPHVDSINPQAAQYINDAAYREGYRCFEFAPL